MGKKLGLGLLVIGLGVTVFGIRLGADSGIRIPALSGGFITTVLGMGALLFQRRGMETRGEKQGETDTPTRVRLIGIGVTLSSLLLPYIAVPLDPSGERVAYSFIGLLNALRVGTEVDGGLTLLIFMSVVMAGAFSSFLHHVGGYVVLFGSVGYGYIVRELVGRAPLEIVLYEFQMGLYVALFGASVIIASSFLSYEAKERERSWYGGG